MKKIVLLLFIPLLFVSCLLPEENNQELKANPFSNPIIVDNSSDSVSFALISDEHVRKEKYDNKIKRYDGNFYSFLEDNNFPFVLSLGDFSDDGSVSSETIEFREEILKRTRYLIEALGNHDRHTFKYKSEDIVSLIDKGILKNDNWKITYADYVEQNGYTTGCYKVGDNLSIYVLDTSRRIPSNKQLKWLKNALKEDNSKYRIAITHTNIISGTEANQTLFFSGFADIEIANKLLSIFKEGGISLVLTGHTHSADVSIISDDYQEANLSAYFYKDSPFESEGTFYKGEVNFNEGIFYLTEYRAKNKSIVRTESFKLKEVHNN